MLIFCFLLFLVDYCDAFTNEYLNTSSIGSQMQKFVVSFNSLNLTDISSLVSLLGKAQMEDPSLLIVLVVVIHPFLQYFYSYQMIHSY